MTKTEAQAAVDQAWAHLVAFDAECGKREERSAAIAALKAARQTLEDLGKTEAAPIIECTHPACQLSARTRGLCHGHYQSMRGYVRKGLATEADLERRGLLLPKGTGGNSVSEHAIFKLGDERRGVSS